MNLLKDARDVILATACVTVMRVWTAERDRAPGRWRPPPAPRPATKRATVERERPSIAPASF